MSLVGWWKFDAGTGTDAIDSSGNGNTGTLTGGPTWTDGKIGNSVRLDNTNDYVDISNARSLIQSGSFSVSCWFRPTTTYTSAETDNDYQFSLADALSTNDITVFLDEATGGVIFRHFDSGGAGFSLTGTATMWSGGLWYHVAGTFEVNVAKRLYVNGAQNATIGTNVTRGTTLATSMFIGKLYSGHFFAGSIDDFRIYNHALTAEEVRGLYTGGFHKPYRFFNAKTKRM